jgi:hypothetical protein
MEKEEWKPFRNALDKSERKEFDEMWDIPGLYISACPNSVQLVPLHPIIISILFHHYKELTELMTLVEQIETRVKQEQVLLLIIPLPEQERMKEEGQQEEEQQQSLREPKN